MKGIKYIKIANITLSTTNKKEHDTPRIFYYVQRSYLIKQLQGKGLLLFLYLYVQFTHTTTAYFTIQPVSQSVKVQEL